MNTKELGAGIVAVVKEYVAREIAPRDERIAALETRLERYEWVKSWVDTLSRQPQMKYIGVWTKESKYAYDEGQFVTHDGSVWYCKRHTKEEPGTGYDWQLAVKRGRDAR